jgi:hypothetical protein
METPAARALAIAAAAVGMAAVGARLSELRHSVPFGYAGAVGIGAVVTVAVGALLLREYSRDAKTEAAPSAAEEVSPIPQQTGLPALMMPGYPRA